MVERLLEEAHVTARQAGQRGAERLSHIVPGEEATHEDTTIRFIHTERLTQEFIYDERHTTINHRVNANTHRDSHSVLLFPTRNETEIVQQYEMAHAETDIDPNNFFESKLTEVGNSIVTALLDQWGHDSPHQLDIAAPIYNTGVYPETLLPEDIRWLNAVVPIIETRLAVGDHSFRHLLIPAEEVQLHKLIGREDVDVSDFPRAVEEIVASGAESVAHRFNAQTSRTPELVVDDWSLRFSRPETVASYLENKRAMGAGFLLSGELDGRAYVGFDPELANDLVADMLNRAGTSSSPQLTHSVIKEVSLNVLAGFSDGWADAVKSIIDYSPPEYVDDPVDETVDKLANTLDGRYVFMFTARLTSEDVGSCRVVMMSETNHVVAAVQQLEDLLADMGQ